MEEFQLLKEIIIILSLSVFVVFICHKIKLPPILGFLLTGIVAGPTALGFIEASHEVEQLSEVGVILLLFVIGLEFSLGKLSAIKKIIFVSGSLQVGITILVIFGLSQILLGIDWQSAVFLGFLVSLSSTAIVLKLLQESGDINSPHGKIALGILIFQDIIVVPMMLFTPLIAGTSGNPWGAILELLIKAIIVVFLVILFARFIVPNVLFLITKTKIKELFLLSIVVICFAVAWATSLLGLSLALGAFLAGLIISESEYSHQATSLIIPFREIFTSFFFVSIGMLLDLGFLFEHFFVILGLTIIIFVVKGAIASLSVLPLKYSMRTAIFTGLALFQVGEFAFILSAVGMQYQLIDEATYQYFLCVSISTMAITPVIMKNFDTAGHFLAKSAIQKKLVEMGAKAEDTVDQQEFLTLKDHVIIIGYGLNGKNVAMAAKHANIPYVIVEMNAITVKREREAGEPIFYGDATNEYLLEHLHVHQAKVAVVAISDPAATRKVIINMRAICQSVYLIIRTRFFSEINSYMELGANEVIPEEFETSIEIFSRLLHQYQVPEHEIEAFVHEIRTDHYNMLRPASRKRIENPMIQIPDMNVTCLTVQQTNNQVVGKSLQESNIRQLFNINIVSIIRDEELLSPLTPDTKILLNDLIYVVGNPEDVSNFNEMISER